MSAQSQRIAPRSPARKANGRARLITLVHVARRDLNLSDADYRTILREQGGADSAGDMNIIQLERVVAYLKKQGFKVSQKPKLASDQESKKARAMWLTLHAIGAVRDPSEAALLRYARRQCKVDRLEWAKDMRPIIESLKAWLLRTLPQQVQPYLSTPTASWAAGKGPAWAENWQSAVDRLRYAQSEGHTQVLDEWLSLWDLVCLATDGGVSK